MPLMVLINPKMSHPWPFSTLIMVTATNNSHNYHTYHIPVIRIVFVKLLLWLPSRKLIVARNPSFSPVRDNTMTTL
jgi:hypothetical protein